MIEIDQGDRDQDPDEHEPENDVVCSVLDEHDGHRQSCGDRFHDGIAHGDRLAAAAASATQQ